MKQTKEARLEIRLDKELKDMLVEALGKGGLSDITRDLLRKYLKKHAIQSKQ